MYYGNYLNKIIKVLLIYRWKVEGQLINLNSSTLYLYALYSI